MLILKKKNIHGVGSCDTVTFMSIFNVLWVWSKMCVQCVCVCVCAYVCAYLLVSADVFV